MAAAPSRMTPLSQRPRAPSPPGNPDPRDNFSYLRHQANSRMSSKDYDNESNAYSTVDGTVGSMRGRNLLPLPPKTRIDRMFGDSVCQSSEDSCAETASNHHLTSLINKNLSGSNRKGSLSSNASSSTVSSRRGGSLANLYQARKNSVSYDAATVNQIKNQFQAQIESMLQSQVRNNQPVRSGHIQSTSERELNEIRGLQRGKSFDEARTAVQKQIERIFNTSQNAAAGVGTSNGNVLNLGQAKLTGAIRDSQTKSLSNLLQNPHNGVMNKGSGIKHGMHGVSHALPGELDDDIRPPPMHYGVNQAIKSGSSHLLKKNFLSNDDIIESTSQIQPSTQHQRLVSSHDSLLESSRPVSSSMTQIVDSRLAPPPSFSSTPTSQPSRPETRASNLNDLGNIDVARKSSSSSVPSTPKTPSSIQRRQTTFGEFKNFFFKSKYRTE